MGRPATREDLLARIDSDFESLRVEVDRASPGLRAAEGGGLGVAYHTGDPKPTGRWIRSC